MSEEFKSQRTFTVTDLLTKPNVVLETIDDFEEGEEEEDDALGFTNRNFTNHEVLKYLTVGENDENETENDNDDGDAAKTIPCGISFEKLKENMTDISGEGKVFKSIKRAGAGEVVPEDAMVSIHYMGYFEYQDESFDSTYLRESCHRARLNDGSLIAGLEIGIQTMRKLEVAHFIIHPDYAYGALGCPPRLPPNSEVMFSVYLIDYIDNAAADTYDNLTQEERKSLAKSFPKAMAFHATANDDFKRNRVQKAIKGYRTVVEILGKVQLENEEEQNKQQKALSKALVNLGVCYNKIKEPRKACIACRDVPVANAKAHFTYAKALVMMGEYEQAMRELHSAKKCEPNNQRIIVEMRELSERIRKYRNEEKQLWSKCISAKKEEKGEMGRYAKVAKEICEKLKNDPDLLRQNLPAGLNDQELECFKQQAAALGLSVTRKERYRNLEFYLSKPNYETQRRA